MAFPDPLFEINILIFTNKCEDDKIKQSEKNPI